MIQKTMTSLVAVSILLGGSAAVAAQTRPRVDPRRDFERASAKPVERGARWERTTPRRDMPPAKTPARVEPRTEPREPERSTGNRRVVDARTRWERGGLTKKFNDAAKPTTKVVGDPPPTPRPKPPTFPGPR